MSLMVEIGEPSRPVSYSAFRTWVSCQERFRQLRSLKRKRQPGWALVGGSAVHLVTQWWETEVSRLAKGAGK